MSAKELLISPEVCDGCGECERACRRVHGLDPGAAAGIRIAAVADSTVPVLCRNCDDAPCVSACMPGCRYRDETTGRVVTDYERCVGCWMCVMLCPFGAIERIPAEEGRVHGVARKCDGCVSEERPACVDACSKGGIQRISPRGLAQDKRLRAALKLIPDGG